jgi:hypothetical protein
MGVRDLQGPRGYLLEGQTWQSQLNLL